MSPNDEMNGARKVRPEGAKTHVRWVQQTGMIHASCQCSAQVMLGPDWVSEGFECPVCHQRWALQTAPYLVEGEGAGEVEIGWESVQLDDRSFEVRRTKLFAQHEICEPATHEQHRSVRPPAGWAQAAWANINAEIDLRCSCNAQLHIEGMGPLTLYCPGCAQKLRVGSLIPLIAVDAWEGVLATRFYQLHDGCWLEDQG